MSQLLAPSTQPVGRDAQLRLFTQCLQQTATKLDETLDHWRGVLRPEQVDHDFRPRIDRELANCVRNASDILRMADRAAFIDAANHPDLDDVHNRFLLAAANLRQAIARAVEARRGWHIPAGMSTHRRLGEMPFPIR